MSEVREFRNKFPDYDGSPLLTEGKLKIEVETALVDNVVTLLQELEKRLTTEVDAHDVSIYTGISGIALMYHHLAKFPQFEGKFEGRESFTKDALTHIESAFSHLKKKYYSFMCGVTGPLTAACLILHNPEDDTESRNLSQRIENLERDVSAGELCDEVLYGRAGYLYALLLIKKLLFQDEFQDRVLRKVVGSILKSGKHWAKRSRNTMNFPLYYEWHDKAYVGAAHGFVGIFYMLLQAKDYMSEDDLNILVKPSVDLVMSLQFPSGNFPSSLGNNTDKLIHWCHGAPGVVHMLLSAYEVFNEEKYLESAKKCGEVIWSRGLLKKGYGICHGVAGNGYALLRLFQVTKEEKYLYRALKFAEWCYDYGKHGCRAADRPLSLYEGLAGTIYFLADMLDPINAAFPGFQL